MGRHLSKRGGASFTHFISYSASYSYKTDKFVKALKWAEPSQKVGGASPTHFI